MSNSVPIIDADAHVIETERTWDYLDPSERKYSARSCIPRPPIRPGSTGSSTTRSPVSAF